jgi:hypothetical protein
MWVLVFINIMFNAEAGYDEPFIEAYYEFDTMEQCFLGRENLLDELGSITEYFPKGTQAVCINNGDRT